MGSSSIQELADTLVLNVDLGETRVHGANDMVGSDTSARDVAIRNLQVSSYGKHLQGRHLQGRQLQGTLRSMQTGLRLVECRRYSTIYETVHKRPDGLYRGMDSAWCGHAWHQLARRGFIHWLFNPTH